MKIEPGLYSLNFRMNYDNEGKLYANAVLSRSSGMLSKVYSAETASLNKNIKSTITVSGNRINIFV